MRKRWYFMILPLMCFVLFACSENEVPDGDVDGDTEAADGISVGLPCTSDSACGSKLCYPFSDDRRACSTPCTSDAECSALSLGTCCQTTKENQNICYPADLCSPSCENPGEKYCYGNFLYTCDENSRLTDKVNCVDDGKICSGGQCIFVIDGDSDIEYEIEDDSVEIEEEVEEPVYECGDPCASINLINRDASDSVGFFLIGESNPSNKASVFEIDTSSQALFTGFDDNKYAKLTLDSVTSGPLDGDGNSQELVFLLDVDSTYKYDIEIDYVCGRNWGQAALYIDNELVKRKDVVAELEDYIELNCTPHSESGEDYDEKPLGDRVAYQTVCLEEGQHRLQVRVVDKKSTSNGYTIGVDKFLILPSIEYKDENCESQF